MSLALTAARLAAIEALRSHPAIAAACPDRVFDSRMGEFESATPVPTIVVTTEDLDGKALSANNGGAPFRDVCDLNVEIALTQHVLVEGEPAIFRPETDREQEASLNLLCWCAEQMLTTGRPQPLARPTAGGLLLAKVIRRTTERHVTRFVSDQTGEKLAIHLAKFRIELKAETPDARSVPTGEFASLPDPLRTVAEGLTSPSGLQTCRMIAAALAAPAPTILRTAAINPAGQTTPVPASPVPPLTIPLAESPLMRRHVTPAHPRATIHDPERGRRLPPTGAAVAWSAYWARLEMRGDVTVSDLADAVADAEAQPEPSPAGPAEHG